MGAKITGENSHTISIDGAKDLRGAEHTIIPDRVEAGTYILASAITGDRFYIKNAVREHLSSLEDILLAMGIRIHVDHKGLYVTRSRAIPRSADITTLPYPGFPTDLQAQMMTLLSLADGIGVITEKIFPERFMHISELNRMGANIKLEGSCAIIRGNAKFIGAHVMASDLRASAALVLAALGAKGGTDIHRVYHLDRGYEKMEWKLARLGAKIKRKKE